MKKSVHLLTFICLFSTVIFAQVSQTHMALVTKNTATWCKYCGTWGWELQENIKTDNNSNSVILQVHSSNSSELYSPAAAQLQNAFPFAGYLPAWFVNGINRTAEIPPNGISPTLTRTKIHNDVDSTYNILPLANCEYTKTLDGNDLTINTTTQFFADTSGDFYLSVIIVENDVLAYQNGIGNNANHMGILRGSASSSVFGEMIASGSIMANSIYNKTFTKTLNSSWEISNLTLAFVIWKKVDTKYFYVNAFKDDVALDVEEYGVDQSAFIIHPNPTSGKIIIKNTELNKTDALISIHDIRGKLLMKQHLKQDKTVLDIGELAKGTYILKLKSNDKTELTKIVKN